MMQTFAAPAHNIVLIIYLLSLPPACGQIMDHLIEYQSLTVIWAHYEITITASHGLAHHHSTIYYKDF